MNKMFNKTLKTQKNVHKSNIYFPSTITVVVVLYYIINTNSNILMNNINSSEFLQLYILIIFFNAIVALLRM